MANLMLHESICTVNKILNFIYMNYKKCTYMRERYLCHQYCQFAENHFQRNCM